MTDSLSPSFPCHGFWVLSSPPPPEADFMRFLKRSIVPSKICGISTENDTFQVGRPSFSLTYIPFFTFFKPGFTLVSICYISWSKNMCCIPFHSSIYMLHSISFSTFFARVHDPMLHSMILEDIPGSWNLFRVPGLYFRSQESIAASRNIFQDPGIYVRFPEYIPGS